jgi:hypothetical protein
MVDGEHSCSVDGRRVAATALIDDCATVRVVITAEARLSIAVADPAGIQKRIDRIR